MKERPILFSGPMVRAIIDGRKTQTRRIIKPQPPECVDGLHGGHLRKRAPYRLESNEGLTVGHGFEDEDGVLYRCPYGIPGDRLWVRESFNPLSAGKVEYRADFHDGMEPRGGSVHWRPSIHMKRSMSRISLAITGIRVERVQDISAADAVAEGIDCEVCDQTLMFRDYMKKDLWIAYWNDEEKDHDTAAVESYQSLWEKINGPASWAANPWVWVVAFERVEAE